jgi:hypothetical protein
MCSALVIPGFCILAICRDDGFFTWLIDLYNQEAAYSSQASELPSLYPSVQLSEINPTNIVNKSQG